MKSIRHGGRLSRALVASTLVAFLSACGGEAQLNTEDVTYTPEQRPIGIIAGDGAEYEPGAQVTLTGRLVGTVDNESVLWTQTEGPAVDVADWTQPTISFTAPMVEGIASLSFQIAAIDGNGEPLLDDSSEPMTDEVSIAVFDPASLLVFEVEDDTVATLNSVNAVGAGDDAYIQGASGSHTADITPGASVVYNLNFNADQAGFYTLYVRYAIPTDYGGKVGQVTVNGVPTDMDFSATGTWSDHRVGTIQLEEGANVIEVGGGWSYYRIDNISMIPAPAPVGPLPVPVALTNPDASGAALDLMEFLVGHYGSATLSGQTEFPTRGSGDSFELFEFEKITSATGDDAPAIVAFDLMDFSASRVANGADPAGLSEDMIAAHNDKNVILSALWHWNAPSGLYDTEELPWYQGFYTENTSFDLAAALADPNGAEYQLLIDDIDTVAAELKKFADADIPILWRPLHEAEGAWFWWGAAGAEALKELWVLMYDRMTQTHGLGNLIWVYTHAGDVSSDWYPGDMYVDIVGYDGYDGNNADNPFASQYSTLKNRHNGKKLVALTETGTIPNVEQMHASNAWWSFFITWNSGGEYGPEGIDAATIDNNYAFDGVINLDDVPGGRLKAEAGLYEGFEADVLGWHGQVSWATVDGAAQIRDQWASSGEYALSMPVDLTAHEAPSNTVLQVYPVDGLDVSEVSTLAVDVASANAGVNTTAYLFIKHGDDQEWVSTDAVASSGGASLTLDVSAYEWLAGVGVVFENFDSASTDAVFYLDNLSLDGTSKYDFEPSVDGWHGQLSWATVGGITASDDWSVTGARSLALHKDLSSEAEAPSNVVLQNYPDGGLDVSANNSLQVVVNTNNAGAGTTAYLFIKHGEDQVWESTAAVTATDGILEMDISGFDLIAGLGVVFENFDAASTDASFFLDSVSIDGALVYDFESTGDWAFQVNWGNTTGIHLSTAWSSQGQYSLAGSTQLVEGDDDIILQTYPAGGILLGDVGSLKVTAATIDSGDATQVMLWAKDQDGNWRDSGAQAVSEAGAELLLDISDWSELQGFGVRFMGPDNAASESRYFVDQVEFVQ